MQKAASVLALATIGALVVSACASAPKARGGAQMPSTETASAVSPEATEDGAGDSETEPEEEEAPAANGEERGPCPGDMALVADRVCVDKYEASLVEVMADGTERPYPNNLPVDGHEVRAVSVAGVLPQGFISEVQAQDACAASGKRLCTHDEWKTACMGPSKTTFPYGDARRPGACHDTGKSAVIAVFGAKAVAASTPYPGAGVTAVPRTNGAAKKHGEGASSGKERKAHATKGRAASTTRARATASTTKSSTGSTKTAKSGSKSASKRVAMAKKSQKPMSVDPGVWAKLNDPALGQVDGALAKTGDHAECVNGWGVFDMVGNIHEWVATDASLPNGTFAGGYYLDTTINGDGCNYRTVAHAHDYHDYSTGFRCCAEPKASLAKLPR